MTPPIAFFSSVRPPTRHLSSTLQRFQCLGISNGAAAGLLIADQRHGPGGEDESTSDSE
jgi:hypothetical protein